MKPLLLGLLLAIPVLLAPGAASACHSDEESAGLCGSAREPEGPRDVVNDCRLGQEVVCAGRLQRAKDVAILVGRYTALGRASLDGSLSRR